MIDFPIALPNGGRQAFAAVSEHLLCAISAQERHLETSYTTGGQIASELFTKLSLLLYRRPQLSILPKNSGGAGF
jgi:hypothetical protein